MAKKLHDTEIWEQDWFIELRDEYRWFFLYIKDKVDAGGIWRPNKAQFESMIKKKIDLYDFLDAVNKDKQRFVVLKNQRWLLVDYFNFQYGRIIKNSSPHKGAVKAWVANEAVEHVRGVDNINEINLQEFISKGFQKGSKGLDKSIQEQPNEETPSVLPAAQSTPVINGHDVRSTVLQGFPQPIQIQELTMRKVRVGSLAGPFLPPEIEFYDDGSPLAEEIVKLVTQQSLTFFAMHNKIQTTQQMKDVLEKFIKKVQSEQNYQAANKLLHYLNSWYAKSSLYSLPPGKDDRTPADSNTPHTTNTLSSHEESDRDYTNVKLHIDE
jgi:hypothetical protein